MREGPSWFDVKLTQRTLWKAIKEALNSLTVELRATALACEAGVSLKTSTPAELLGWRPGLRR